MSTTNIGVITLQAQFLESGGNTCFGFFFNLSDVNSYILEKLAGNKNGSQLAFRRELARLLIAGYNGYKRPSSSDKRAIQTLTREVIF